jgi:hypothetical protein
MGLGRAGGLIGQRACPFRGVRLAFLLRGVRVNEMVELNRFAVAQRGRVADSLGVSPSPVCLLLRSIL